MGWRMAACKTCIDCREPKSLSEFYRRKRATGGYRSYCNACTRIRNAKSHAANRTTRLAARRVYYANNKGKVQAAVLLYAENHREERRMYLRRYRETHRQEGAKYQNARRKTIKGKASALLRRAVARGDIVKPARCSCCGRYTKRRSLHGHHDDYTKPLDVRWLCTKCHGMARRAG